LVSRIARFSSGSPALPALSCGPIVLGIRDVSRDLQFKSGYTLVEHAPEDSIELEIKAHALLRQRTKDR